ncbi:jg15208 [Pararge aegeria aegeria]|uniref:Jg15208 protein n=1 Tax=Pararge aegeria aegeria TaxID=348720 RepID=A0A8S4QEM4_9NEOP|nr:jg15208 [Pararge aegeria aegeria]
MLYYSGVLHEATIMEYSVDRGALPLCYYYCLLRSSTGPPGIVILGKTSRWERPSVQCYRLFIDDDDRFYLPAVILVVDNGLNFSDCERTSATDTGVLPKKSNIIFLLTRESNLPDIEDLVIIVKDAGL